MPGGGVGPLRVENIGALRRAKRGDRMPSDATDLQIYYLLGLGRVYFDAVSRRLFFVHSENDGVPDVIQAVMGRPLPIESRPIDEHAMFNPLMCVTLPEDNVQAILVALQIQGLQVYSS